MDDAILIEKLNNLSAQFLYNNGKGYFVYKRKRYKSLRACCMNLKISYSAVTNRISRGHCSPTKAIDVTLERKHGKEL